MNSLENTASLSPLQRAFLALAQAEAKLAAKDKAEREPVAVIGLGCRVPGGGNDGASFWRLLTEQVDAIGPVPADRWDHEAIFDPDPSSPGRIATRQGGFIAGVDQFDPLFFGIAPREAAGMDPHQRLLLEVCWEALEHAGLAPDLLEGSATGVYIGACSSDYAYLQLKTGDAALLNSHFGSGIAHSIISGRLSYLLGLQGPSLTIDTACSSSLVAVHLACQALRSGDCRMALAGGVNLILSPDIFIALSHARMLAPDGRCKTFDASADGFGRSEGCGVVVLKRLSDAEADGDRVLAVIRGSAVNQDGPSSGLTAPNGPAQEAVIREALRRAQIAPADVGLIEAHGTGTELGDPLEMQALGAVFGKDRDPADPLWVASVKTNIGHLEAAAGVTGLIKLVQALRYRTIPAHLHFRTPSPHIDWSELPLRIPTETSAWQSINGRRIAGVSSFGFSGTNAHVVLEEAPSSTLHAAAPAGPQMLPISAATESALVEVAARYAVALEDASDSELADICYTASAGRAQFAHRATIKAQTVSDLREGLGLLASGKQTKTVRYAHVIRRDPPRIAFLFTGQGSQYFGMAKGLYDTFPTFRATLDRCAEILKADLDLPLLDLLFGKGTSASLLDRTAYTQPALFSIEYSLAQLWRTWGITPSVVLGHSVGQYAAACVAGIFSLEGALRLVAFRARVMQSLPAGGAMAAIFASGEIVSQRIAPLAKRVGIAAFNTQSQTVISGAEADVRAICQQFSAEGVRCQHLSVSHAFHSPLMEPILGRFEKEASSVRFSPPQLQIISDLTGRPAQTDEITAPAYWARHVREPIRFYEALGALASAKVDCCIEIGPHPALLSFASTSFAEQPGAPQLLPSLRKGQPDVEQMYDALSSLYLAGAQVNWRGLGQGAFRHIVDLPTYPFQRQRCWFEANSAPVQPVPRMGDHPLLGTRKRSPIPGAIFEAAVSADTPAFVREHSVQGQIILPATAFLEMFLACGEKLFSGSSVAVEDVVISEPMLFRDDAMLSVQTVSAAIEDGITRASISSLPHISAEDALWTEHAEARLQQGPSQTLRRQDLVQLRAQCDQSVAVDNFYESFASRGLDFGNGFQSLTQILRGEGQSLCEVALSPAYAAEEARFCVHPVLLDGCLQAIAAALPDFATQSLYLPIGIGRFALSRRPGTRCWAYACLRTGNDALLRYDVWMLHDDGVVVAELLDVQLRRATPDALKRADERWLDNCLYETRWHATTRVSGQAHGNWSPQILAASATRQISALREAADIDAYGPFQIELEALCADFTVRAMRQLDWLPSIGEEVSDLALARQLGVVTHQRLFSRLLDILEEGGWLVSSDKGRRVVRRLEEVDCAAICDRLMRTCPAGADAELELTGRASASLADALRGACNPLELLFPGGSLDTAERLYRDSPTARFFNGLLAEVIVDALKERTPGTPLRILEIGGGTGGTTAHLLPRLPSKGVEYTFTDIGAAFVSKAREKFGGYEFATFEMFDLEQEPQSQGFASRHFDIIVAANVVHATSDLRRTLARISQLLAPGGLLAMLEVTAPQRWFDLTVGMTEGWWAFTDTDLRPKYSLISRAHWLQLLPEHGFDAVATLPEQSESAGALALQSLFLARAGPRRVPATPRNWLVFDAGDGLAARLAAQLTGRSDHCTLVAQGRYHFEANRASIEPVAANDYRRLLADCARTGRLIHGVIHTWSLASAWEDIDAKDLIAAQQLGAISVALLAQALASESMPPRLWVVTRGAQQAHADDRRLCPAQSPVWGLGNAIRREHPELQCVNVDLDPASPGDESALIAELGEADTEPQIAFRGDDRLVPRLVHKRLTAEATGRLPSFPWRLVPSAPGSFNGFEFVAAPRRKPGPNEVEIEAHATGLNFKDVLNVLGMYPGDPGPLGGECAGRVTAVGDGVAHVCVGDKVMAVAGGSLASHVIAKSELVQPRPREMSAKEAASFPIAYLTAEFCLGHLAKIRAGDRVLIHAAAGGVGMAAVRLAQRAGAEVFATAGAAWKQDLLRSMDVPHVFSSRTSAFADEILKLTNGTGVNVVLNSLAGDLIEPSFRALAQGGRFVEIGKRGIKDPGWVTSLGREISYHIVDWGQAAEEDPKLVGALFAGLVDELRQGRLLPLPRHAFGIEDTPRAFRLMAQAQHAGKIVLLHKQEKTIVRRDGTYLVVGGFSGLGLLVAQRLAQSGAGRIALIGRRGVTPKAVPVLEKLRADGIDVVTEAVDVTDEAALGSLLARLRASGPPIRGVVHSAGVLDDAGLMQQNADRLARVLAPKVHGAWLLDKLTRGDAMDFFVLFSSVASILGSMGQTNHSAANAFLDLMALQRHSRGLPGISMIWGAWLEVGAAADETLSDRLAAQGIVGLTPAQGLAAFERLLEQTTPQIAVFPVEWDRYAAHLGRSGPTAFLSAVARPPAVARRDAIRQQSPSETLQQVLADAPVPRRFTIVAAFVCEHALKVLGLSPTAVVDPRTPLGDLGLDSLLAVELRNILSSALGKPLPATLLFDYPTIDTLAHFLIHDILKMSDRRPNSDATQHGNLVSSMIDKIGDLSDDEVERRLAARTVRKTSAT